MDSKEQELYDRICRVLTWYEHPKECPFVDEGFDVAEEMYDVLCCVQNELFND